MQENVVLRFRDLVDQTIIEHRKRIDEFGYVWWGWWNKPDEKIPRQIFTRFQEKISKDNYLWLFLSDSGTLRLYKAKLIEIDMASEEEPKECKEIEKVPEYYFSSKYKVWLCFSNIIDTTPDEIREWAFIFDDDLKDNDEIKNYHNKRIDSIQEMLNCCHRTIYHIQPYDPKSHKEWIDKEKVESDEDAKPEIIIREYVLKILELIENVNKQCDYAPQKASSPILMPPYPIEVEKGLSTPANDKSTFRDFSSHIYMLIVDGHEKALKDYSVLRKSYFLQIAGQLINDIRLFRCDFHHRAISKKDKQRLGHLYKTVCGKSVLDDSNSMVRFQIDILKRVQELMKTEFELVKKSIQKL